MALSRRGMLLSCASLLPGARLLRAQQPAQSPTTFSTDVKVVNVLATVRDKQGSIVKDLAKDTFVLEEDAQPREIKYFAQQTDLPLTLGLLVDTSGSQRRLIGQERAASSKFFNQVLREDKDMAFVIHFDFEVELLADLTGSKKALQDALDAMEGSRPAQLRRRPPGSGGGGGGGYPGGGQRRGGGTDLYDSVLLASDEILKKQSGRKAIILLSDGVDTGSRVPITEAIESAQRADALIYAIRFFDQEAYGNQNRVPMGGMGGRGRRGGMGGPRPVPGMNMPDGKKVLQRLARETGGSFFDVSKKQPLEDVFHRIEEELRSQYNLGFTPVKQDPPGTFHKIKLTAKQKNLVVQTRDGYYTTK